MREINGKKVARSFSYMEYRDLTNELFDKGMTTGENHSESMMDYTKMNIQRMKRWDKKIELSQDMKMALNHLNCTFDWVVISEAWCGDAAQNLPVLAAVAEASDKINLHIILRDENPEIMDDYLTNGGRSIPKLIVFRSDSGNEVTTWGPRPAELQKMVMDNKYSENPIPYSEFSIEIQKWYNNDKGQTLQKEVLEMIKGCLEPLVQEMV